MSMDSPAPTPPPGNPLIGYSKLVVLERYAKFDGRANRAEFWWFYLAYVIGWFVLGIIDSVIGLGGILVLLYFLAMFIPVLAVTVRRLHDTDKSGWFVLLQLICFIGTIILIVFLVTEGTKGPNKYGASAT